MDMDDIGAACLMVYDELKDDAESADLIEKIDTAEGDDAIKEGLREAVKRLEALEKFAIANDIRKKATGFAF
jgi:ribosomal protein L7Ae-like RNA K-turn-binding protein